MARGFQGVRQASADIEARRGSGGASSAMWFRLENGQEAFVRFLEQGDDIFWCYMHEIPRDDRSYGEDIVCINQDDDGTPCPGCEQDLKRKFKGFINLIWFEAPIFKRDNENKLVRENGKLVPTGKTKPQVAIWGSGIRVFEELDEIDTNYRGLRSRRFRVRRKGESLSTKYSIAPADVDAGKQEFTDEEKRLDSEKYDLSEQVKPPTYDEFLKRMGSKAERSQNGDGEAPKSRANPFMRNK